MDLAAALERAARAIDLNPGDASTHTIYANGYLSPTGRTQDAVIEIRRAHELDPLSPAVWLEEAVCQRNTLVIWAKVHPWLDSLRSDPRYDVILHKLNLAD